jgi:hypothetical protein
LSGTVCGWRGTAGGNPAGTERSIPEAGADAEAETETETETEAEAEAGIGVGVGFGVGSTSVALRCGRFGLHAVTRKNRASAPLRLLC